MLSLSCSVSYVALTLEWKYLSSKSKVKVSGNSLGVTTEYPITQNNYHENYGWEVTVTFLISSLPIAYTSESELGLNVGVDCITVCMAQWEICQVQTVRNY